MFSNRPATSHMIHCETPRILSARPTATVIEPTVISDSRQAMTESAATAASSSELITFTDQVNPVISRICLWTVSRNSSMAPRA